MAAQLIDPVVKFYLFHDSPLNTARGKWTLGIVAAVLLVLSLIGWPYFLGSRDIFQYLIWVPLAIIGSAIGYLVLAFLDRERRVRFFHFLIIGVTLFFLTAISALVNKISTLKYWTVGLNEETVKIIPVLLLAIFIPNLIRTRKDGLVYGALAGMGLNIIEIGSYIAMAIDKNSTVMEALTTHLTRLSLFGIGSHIIWTAFVGMGIGMAAESTKTGLAKWKYAILYYVLVVIAHTVYDFGASQIGLVVIMGLFGILGADTSGQNPGEPGPLNTAFRYGPIVYNLAFLIAEYVNVRKSFAMENALQAEELSTEDREVITQAELELLKRESLFSKRKYSDYPNPVGSKIVLYQNLLAIQKHDDRKKGRDVESDKVVLRLRQAICSLRGQ